MRVSAWCVCGCRERENLGWFGLAWDWDKERSREERESFACRVVEVEQEHRMESRPNAVAYGVEEEEHQRNIYHTRSVLG